MATYRRVKTKRQIEQIRNSADRSIYYCKTLTELGYHAKEEILPKMLLIVALLEKVKMTAEELEDLI